MKIRVPSNSNNNNNNNKRKKRTPSPRNARTRNNNNNPSCALPPGYTRNIVLGDGRCLFRSIILAENDAIGNRVPLSEDEEKYYADLLRRDVVRVIRDNKHMYETFWKLHANMVNANNNYVNLSHKNYVAEMSNPKTYGHQVEIMIAALLLNRRICVQSVTSNGTYTTPYGPIDYSHVNGRRRKLYLHLTGRHYTPYLRDMPVFNPNTFYIGRPKEKRTTKTLRKIRSAFSRR